VADSLGTATRGYGGGYRHPGREVTVGLQVTVVTVCLNAASTITQTLESVLDAGDSVVAYVVVDGGSTDGTIELVKAFEPKFEGRLTWVSEPDDGVYPAMNRGLQLASDSFVLFLGADDALLPGSLDRVAERLGPEPDDDMIFGDVRVVEPNGSKHEEPGCIVAELVGPIPRSMPACHQAILFSLAAYRQLGGFDTSLAIAADYDFYLRFLEHGLQSVYVPVVISEFRLGGLSSARGVATAQEYRRVWVKHGVHPVVAWLRMVRSVVNLYAMKVLRRIPGRTRQVV